MFLRRKKWQRSVEDVLKDVSGPIDFHSIFVYTVEVSGTEMVWLPKFFKIICFFEELNYLVTNIYFVFHRRNEFQHCIDTFKIHTVHKRYLNVGNQHFGAH